MDRTKSSFSLAISNVRSPEVLVYTSKTVKIESSSFMGALSLCNKKYVKITMVLMHKIVRRKPVIIHFSLLIMSLTILKRICRI